MYCTITLNFTYLPLTECETPALSLVAPINLGFFLHQLDIKIVRLLSCVPFLPKPISVGRALLKFFMAIDIAPSVSVQRLLVKSDIMEHQQSLLHYDTSVAQTSHPIGVVHQREKERKKEEEKEIRKNKERKKRERSKKKEKKQKKM